MRINLMLILILLFSVLSCSAAQTSGTMTVTVLVSGSFNMMVDTDSFDFARLSPGQAGEMTRKEGISVTCSSSNGEPWYLFVSAPKPLTSGSDQISNDRLVWSGIAEGQGDWKGRSERPISKDGAAYASSINEANEGSKIRNNFNFSLNVPEDTKPGNYTTTVMFTMTE